MPTITHHRLNFDVTSFIDDTIWSDQQRIAALHALTGSNICHLGERHITPWYRNVMGILRTDYPAGHTWYFMVEMISGVIDYEKSRFAMSATLIQSVASPFTWPIKTPLDFKDFMINSPLDINEYEQWLLNNDRDMRYWNEMANQTTRLREKENKPQPFNPTPPKKLGRRNLKPVPLP